MIKVRFSSKVTIYDNNNNNNKNKEKETEKEKKKQGIEG